jgi:beta-galactosidase
MRERLSLDRNWRFALGHASDAARDFDFVRDRSLVKAGEARGAAAPVFDDSGWRTLDVPHDWAIELPFDPTGDKELCDHGFHAIGPDHPESSVGWYRRAFDIPAADLGRRISVEFDGVFRDSVVWINGHRLGRHASGYVGFHYDLTDLLHYGGRNVLAVRADASCYEGWWYEGAGIYRHVWLVKTAPLHVARWGTFVTTELCGGSARATMSTTVRNDRDAAAEFELVSTVVAPDGSDVAAETARAQVAPWTESELVQQIGIARPLLWSCREPNLYRLRTTIRRASETVDSYDTTFGIRTLRWDADRGFFLNGEPVKIKGTCNHQHHAGVGTAMPDRLHELRLAKLKAMGSNAYRCSHYAATPELLDACDRLGLLVMAENRLAGSGPEFRASFESMIRRDRNHPSIILWSIGNEEHTIQWSVTGERIGRTLRRVAHELDPTRAVTAAMHDRGLGEGFANVVDVHGWNYIAVGDIEPFHRARPQQPIVGSEEGSTVCTRGVYADDQERGYVSAYDRRAPKWGSTAERWWTFVAERPWLAGAFLWTGFDYKGEPIPYKWPCTASHFGLMDLCGFPKDNFYYFQSWWSDRPVLHLFPHWTCPGREGQDIDVRCFTNHEQVELLLNGRSLGRRDVRRNAHAAWSVRYEPGTLEARGYRDGRHVATTTLETAGAPARLLLTSERATLDADGEDVSLVAVSALDAAGRAVPVADHLVHFDVAGPGRLLGVGNGDPSSHESDKAPFRRLFNGLAMAVLQAGREPGTIAVTARAEGVASARWSIDVRAAPPRPFVP